MKPLFLILLFFAFVVTHGQNVRWEQIKPISAQVETTTPAAGDMLLIEDAITGARKYVKISNLPGATETDPIFTAWDKDYNDLINKPAGFTPTDLLTDYGFTDNSTNWNTAHGWGDHSLAGYLTSYTETDPTLNYGLSQQIPYMNTTNDGFLFASNFTFNGTDFITTTGKFSGGCHVMSGSGFVLEVDGHGFTSMGAAFGGFTLQNTVYGQYLRIWNSGKWQFYDYGLGNFTGTAAKILAVESDGDLIEVDPASIGGDGTGTDDQTASEVNITDADGHYTATTVEGALDEIGDANYLTSYTETDPVFTAWDKDYNDLINKPSAGDMFKTTYDTNTDNKIDLAAGGTGVTTFDSYELLIGSTGNYIDQVVGVGTTGQVLTSNGPGAKPTFQTTAASLWTDYSSFNFVVANNNRAVYSGDTGSAIYIKDTDATETGTGTIGIDYDGGSYDFFKLDGNDQELTALYPVIQPVSNGAKTASFTHNAAAASIGAYTLSTSGAVTVSIHNLVNGAMGTIFLDVSTNPSAITVTGYTDAGTTAISAANVRENTIANAANETTTITYTYANNGTNSILNIIYGQLD